MREIKFRAWDKKEMQMIYQGDNSTQINGVMDCQISFDMMGHAVFVRYYGEDNSHEIKETELMQYTGLKDINGKEIYESDIVNMHYFTESFNAQTLGAEEKENEVVGIIKIIDCTLFVEDEESLYVVSDYVEDAAAQIEIIGNIYENPELLEG